MKSLILKIKNSAIHSEQNLNKVVGLIDPKSTVSLITNSNLEANPRLSKTGKVTDAILESLEKTPELFLFKSKGILLSTKHCDELDRGRFRVYFEDSDIEGILDGGHNTLALGIHILNKSFPDEEFKIKTWDDLHAIWNNPDTQNGIERYITSMPTDESFLVPFELIYPSKLSNDQYIDNILDISAARNNNSELTIATKANHAGYYNTLRDSLDKEISDKVEWKTNEPGKSIKSQDIISLSLIPMMVLEKASLLKIPQRINKVSLYSSKGQCIKIFNDIIEAHSTRDEEGNLNISDAYIADAFNIMKDIPKIYDLIYRAFPDAYNKKSSRFGGITAVTKFEGEGRQPKSKFYGSPVEYKYPDGFIYPIIASLDSLLEFKDGALRWKVSNPCDFIERHLSSITDLLVGHIKTHQYNPQSVGKDSQSYKLISVMIDVALAKDKS